MTRLTRITPEFVEFVPKKIDDGVLYISEEYGTASHNCACGCGMRVVTPLTPTDWKLTRRGKSVSLFPSIGNWDYPCQSHYWIKRNQIVWAPKWDRQEIAAGREIDREHKEAYYAEATHRSQRNWLRRLWTQLSSWLSSSDS